MIWGGSFFHFRDHWAYKRHKSAKMPAAQGILTYCANGRTTVPMYADAARLLVFGPFLPSARWSKMRLFDKLIKNHRLLAVIFYVSNASRATLTFSAFVCWMCHSSRPGMPIGTFSRRKSIPLSISALPLMWKARA